MANALRFISDKNYIIDKKKKLKTDVKFYNFCI